MKYLGMASLLFSVWMLCRKYSEIKKKRLEESESFLEFLEFAKSKLSCYMLTLNEIGGLFVCDSLRECGFLQDLSEGKSVKEAYSNARGNLSVSEETDRILSDFFSDFGTGYLEREIERIDASIKRLSSVVDKERKTLKKDVSLIKAVCTAGAMGFIIIFI